MAKFAVLFVAAVAFQAAFAGSSENWQKHQRRMEKFQTTIQEASQEATNAIEKCQTETTQDRRALMAQLNDFSNKVQNVVYNMQRAAQNAQGEEKKTLQQIATKMSESAYSAQQALNAEPTQMKTQLKTLVQNISAECEKLTQHIQQAQQPQEGKWEQVYEIKRAMMDLHGAMRKVQVQAENQRKTTDEVYNQMQNTVNQMATYAQNLKDDAQTAQDLADCARQLSQMMTNMINKLQRKSETQQGETKNIMQQVCNKLSDLRANLEHVANTQGNTQQRVTELKERLGVTMRDAASQAQRLMQIVQRSNDQEGEGMKACTKNMMMDTMAATRTMQMQYKAMVD